MRLATSILLSLSCLACVTPNRPVGSKGSQSIDGSSSSAESGSASEVSDERFDGSLDLPLVMSDGATTHADLEFVPDHAAISPDVAASGSDLAAPPDSNGSSNLASSPRVTVTPSSPTNNPRPTWEWVTDGKGSGTFRYRLDQPDLTVGATISTARSFTPSQPMSEGTHTLYVQEQSVSGQWSASGSQEVQVDLSAPAAPTFALTPRSPLNSARPVWSWASGGGGDGAGYRYKLDDSDLEKGATSVSAGQFQPSTDLAEGPHTLYAQERDQAGNWSGPSSRRIVVALTGFIGGTSTTALNLGAGHG